MILKELSEAFGVSSGESEVRGIIRDAISDYVTDVTVDALGNLLAVRKGTGESPLRVMVAAHMDEVGLMITGIDGNGSLRFSPVGGIDQRVLPGTRVVIGKDKVPGVIGIKPIHLAYKDGLKRAIKMENLRIDIGATGKEDAQKLVKIGDLAAFDVAYTELGPTVRGKAFDDRAGCAVLVELVRGDPFPFDLLAAFTVQEEVGLRGATVAANRFEPDAAFVLEGTICADMPQEPDEDRTTVTRLGHGPAITIMDRSMIANRSLVQHLIATAEANNIPYQFKAPAYGGTDGGAIHLSGAGVPTAVVAVPSRYIHTPYCILSLSDFENTVRLMRQALMTLTPDKLES